MPEIDFKPEDLVLGLWFGGREGQDFLACAWIPKDEQKIKLVYRFRDHNSPSPWDPKDRTRWYEHEHPDASEANQKATILTMNLLFNEYARKFGYTQLDHIPKGTGQEVADIMCSGTKSWCHVRMVPLEGEPN